MRQNIAALLAAVLLLSLCAGCGASDNKEESTGTENAGTSETVYVAYDGSTAAEEETEKEEEKEKEERVLVVYCIGEDFKNRVQDFYPEYEIAAEDSGMIGDVRVEWHVYTDAQQYREELDERLGAQADPDTGSAIEGTEPNEKIDLFVVDETYLRDYVESGWSQDVKSGIGLTQEELSDQFLYTQQMATDGAGRLKAVSWQATPGVFAYRRSIAKEVLENEVFPAFKVEGLPKLDKPTYTLDEFLAIIDENPDLQAVKVEKIRFGYMVNDTICETGDVYINGALVKTINSESTEIEDIKKTISDVGLEGVENINYLQAIKRVIGMINKPLAN